MPRLTWSAAATVSAVPLNSTLFYSVYLYQNAFLFLKMGYASAMAWILFVIILLFTLLLLKVSNKFTYYAG